MASQVPAFVRTLQRQMADYNERVAERIVNARERKGLSAETLALRAGVSVKQMGRIENGKSAPRLSTVRKLAEAMELEVTDLRPDLDKEERDLHAQLNRIEKNQRAIQASQRLIIQYFGIEADDKGHPQTTYGEAYGSAPTGSEPEGPEETEDATPN